MKETKVYVDELPTQCLDCRFAYDGRCQAKGNGESYCVENCRRSDCPLIDIKTHDRELVKEVLEKVKKVAFSSKVMCDKDGSPFYGEKNHTIYGIYDYELNQIQKELEGEDE